MELNKKNKYIFILFSTNCNIYLYYKLNLN